MTRNLEQNGNSFDPQFTTSLSRQDWSLHRKGPKDETRHREKVKEAIRGDLPGIIAQENIITSDGKKIVKVPIKSLELPRFRYGGNNGNGGVGQGEGGTGEGQSIGPGKGKQAGNIPGIDYYEAEIEMAELERMVFEDLQLPFLEKKQQDQIVTESDHFNEVAKKGIMGNLDKRRTILQNVKRNAMKGKPEFKNVKDEDLRFKIWTTTVRKESNAAVLAMRDVSGSMGEFEKYISRSFYSWMVRFLRTKYSNVDIRFITHHTEAKEVDEEAFFNLGESGGTRVSSAYQKAYEISEKDYDPSKWNVYPFHFSDGDNWGSEDNNKCVEFVNKFLERCNLFGYGEIREGGMKSGTSLMNAFEPLRSNKHFAPVVITDKKGVLPALQTFFSAKGESMEGSVSRK